MEFPHKDCAEAVQRRGWQPEVLAPKTILRCGNSVLTFNGVPKSKVLLGHRAESDVTEVIQKFDLP